MSWLELVSYPTSENGIIFLLHSFNSKSLEVRNTSEKSEKFRAQLKNLDEDAILCNTLRSDRRRLNQKHFLPFRVLLNVGIEPHFPQQGFFLLIRLAQSIAI